MLTKEFNKFIKKTNKFFNSLIKLSLLNKIFIIVIILLFTSLIFNNINGNKLDTNFEYYDNIEESALSNKNKFDVKLH